MSNKTKNVFISHVHKDDDGLTSQMRQWSLRTWPSALSVVMHTFTWIHNQLRMRLPPLESRFYFVYKRLRMGGISHVPSVAVRLSFSAQVVVKAIWKVPTLLGVAWKFDPEQTVSACSFSLTK